MLLNLKMTALATALFEQSFKLRGRVPCGSLLAPVWNSAAVAFLDGNTTTEELKEGGGLVLPEQVCSHEGQRLTCNLASTLPCIKAQAIRAWI